MKAIEQFIQSVEANLMPLLGSATAFQRTFSLTGQYFNNPRPKDTFEFLPELSQIKQEK